MGCGLASRSETLIQAVHDSHGNLRDPEASAEERPSYAARVGAAKDYVLAEHSILLQPFESSAAVLESHAHVVAGQHEPPEEQALRNVHKQIGVPE